jgi:hypothetical protein
MREWTLMACEEERSGGRIERRTTTATARKASRGTLKSHGLRDVLVQMAERVGSSSCVARCRPATALRGELTSSRRHSRCRLGAKPHPQLRIYGERREPANARLAHTSYNREDYSGRLRIGRMLQAGMSAGDRPSPVRKCVAPRPTESFGHPIQCDGRTSPDPDRPVPLGVERR